MQAKNQNQGEGESLKHYEDCNLITQDDLFLPKENDFGFENRTT